MRREKKDVLKDLPPKIIEDYAAFMTPVQLKIYEMFEKSDLAKMN